MNGQVNDSGALHQEGNMGHVLNGRLCGPTTGVGSLHLLGIELRVPVLEVCDLFTVPTPCPRDERYINER